MLFVRKSIKAAKIFIIFPLAAFFCALCGREMFNGDVEWQKSWRIGKFNPFILSNAALFSGNEKSFCGKFKFLWKFLPKNQHLNAFEYKKIIN